MSDTINKKRRNFLQIAGLGAASLAASQLLQVTPALAQSAMQPGNAGVTGLAEGYPAYADIEKRLAALPPITLPAITLDGVTDGNYPAGDGSATAARFLGKRVHRQVPNAGHNLPQEAPKAFADAVIDVLAL